MGGRAGHMSHLYDNPMLSFGELRDVFKKAAEGKLEGTEKTDGQNINISYSVKRDESVAIRNDDHAFKRGFNSGDLAKYMAMVNPALKSLRTGKSRKKNATPEHVIAAFVKAMEDFENFARRLPPELQESFFGLDADIFYNAEVMSPSSRNAIDYDVETILIHRVGHTLYDEDAMDTASMSKEESGNLATTLETYLEKYYAGLEKSLMPVQVGAVIQLQNLSTGAIYNEANIRLNKLLSSYNLSDENNIGQLIIAGLEDIVNQSLPDLNFEARKLLYKRMYAEHYDVTGGETKRQRGIHNKGVLNAVTELTPELEEKIKLLINDSKKIIKSIIYPLEDIIHDFSVEMLRSLESAFILDNKKEVEKLRIKVANIIDTIESSSSDEAIDFLAQQMKKLKRIENIGTAAEGFVFDYDGHTYKFTGNFAPMNQLLGLQKFSRPNIPADLFKEMVPLNEAFTNKGNEFIFIPGGFKPPHRGHIHLIEKAIEKHPKAKPYLVTGETPRDGVSLQQAMQVMRMLLQNEDGLGLDEISIITVPEGGLPVLDEDGQPIKNNAGDIRFSNSPLQAIYNSAHGLPEGATVYIASSAADPQHGSIGESIKKARPDLKISTIVVDPLPGADPDKKMSATAMRRTLLDGDLKGFKYYLPKNSQKQAEYIFTRVLGGRLAEEETEEMPMAESFRTSDLYRLIDEVLDEMATMGAAVGSTGGDIEGALIGTGSKKGPWADLDVEKENEKQKKQQKLKGAKEELVNEVENYLLNTMVGPT